MTQIVASLLLTASHNIPCPEYWRHVAARRDLGRAMRLPQVLANRPL